MSVIIRSSGNIGPFKSVTPWPAESPDRLRCDGADYPFTVLGSYSISNDDSLAPAPPAASVVVPEEVPKDAAVIALIEEGKDGLPELFFNTIEDPKEQKIARAKWALRGTLRRDSTMLATAIAAGVLTSAETDALFVRAAEIAAGAA